MEIVYNIILNKVNNKEIAQSKITKIKCPYIGNTCKEQNLNFQQ